MSLPVSVIPLEDTPQCATSLLEAAQTLGFLYITLPGGEIPASKIDRMWELVGQPLGLTHAISLPLARGLQSEKFFSSPIEEKKKCAISPDNKGWISMQSETLDPQNQRRPDFKEAFNLAEYRDGKPQQPLPSALADHEAEMGEFQALCHALCQKLLRLFAIALEIDPSEGGEEWFTSRHAGPSDSTIRLLHYPALKADEYSPTLDIRAGAHSDYGSLTLLFQRPGEPGLEIHHPITKTWHPVPVLPNAVLVNFGDLFSYWTAGVLRSTVHRVVFPKPSEPGDTLRDRYSMVYFGHPVKETLLTPIPSELVRSRGEMGANVPAPKGGVLTADGHLRERLRVTYTY